MRPVDWAAVEARGGELVRPVAWRLALSAFGLGLCATFGGALIALFASDGVSRADVPWMVLWALLVTLWTALAFRVLWRVARREPIVGYDAEGLHLPGVGAVAWEEISEIRVDEVGRRRSPKLLVGIYLHEPRTVLARAGWRRRWEGRVEVAAHRAPLAIHPFNLPLELWQLARRLQRRHAVALRRHAARAGAPTAEAAVSPSADRGAEPE